ncbi:MAG: hypothetical protein QOF12_2467 [Solirubrobacteraceae bacterium]|jgi:hypothetical protein|nr:hypothetical protein [Solirubrobacteraceae bacterium]
MGSATTLEPLYTSAPIVDYDEDEPVIRPTDEELTGASVTSLAPEAFDAAILAALIAP